MAKAITPKEAANLLTRKRGRPAGTKNKVIKQAQILSFQQQLKEWDRKASEVNYKELCDKLQEALAKSYVDADNLNKTIDTLTQELRARDIIITYLEIRKK